MRKFSLPLQTERGTGFDGGSAVSIANNVLRVSAHLQSKDFYNKYKISSSWKS